MRRKIAAENSERLAVPGMDRVRATLARILASPAFRNSKQCQSFLQWVVERTGSGEDELLKERNIGVEVFGRVPNYDTAEDPIVRVRATEVRKRLSQYYTDSACEDDVRIEIPAGSYRAEFSCEAVKSRPAPPPPPPPPSLWARGHHLSPRWKAAALASVVLVAAGVFAVSRWAAPTKLDDFWSPVLDSPKPVFIYTGRPVAYFLSSQAVGRFRNGGAQPGRALLWEPITLDPDAVLHGRDIVPVTDKFVGIGSAHAAVLLNGLFGAHHKAVDFRYANDVSFSDLRSSPSVLIGAFSNLWTLQLTGQLRFVFVGESQGAAAGRVRDRTKNREWAPASVGPDGTMPDDYAIISRLFDAQTGQPLICIAGIGTYATRSAAEFLTSPSSIEAGLAKAPAGWPKKNLQILIHTDVYKGVPSPARVLDVYTW